MTPVPEIIRWGIFAFAMISAFTDLRARLIPNWLTMPVCLAALIARWFVGGWPSLKEGLIGFAIGFGVYFVFFVLKGRGGGDVKLMGAYGALMGPMNWFILFILTAIFGGLVAVIAILAKGRVEQTLRNIRGLASKDRVTLESEGALALPHGTIAAVPALLMAWAMNLPG